MQFIRISGHFINLAHVRRIEPLADGFLVYINGEQALHAGGEDAKALLAAIKPAAGPAVTPGLKEKAT